MSDREKHRRLRAYARAAAATVYGMARAALEACKAAATAERGK